MIDAHYSLKINPLFSMKNVYIAFGNNQVTCESSSSCLNWTTLALTSDPKCSQQHGCQLQEELHVGPEDSYGVRE